MAQRYPGEALALPQENGCPGGASRHARPLMVGAGTDALQRVPS